jgi:putative copper export protein
MLFVALVVVPTTRGLAPAERAALFGAIGRGFRTVGWACIAMLIVTGTVNVAYRGVTWETLFTAALWRSPFGSTLALKLGVVAVMLGLSLYHDFVIGPRSVRILEQAARASGPPKLLREAGRLRRRASILGRVEAILALLVLALAVILVRGVPSLY